MFLFWPMQTTTSNTTVRKANLLELERRTAEFLAANRSAETSEYVRRQREAVREELTSGSSTG